MRKKNLFPPIGIQKYIYVFKLTHIQYCNQVHQNVTNAFIPAKSSSFYLLIAFFCKLRMEIITNGIVINNKL